MEPILTSLGPGIAGTVAKALCQKAGDRLNKYFHPTNIEQAIKAGQTAAAEWEKQLPQQQHLFYRVKSDGLNSSSNYLDRVFNHNAVSAELQKPLINEGQPEVEVLVKAFGQEAEASNIQLVSGSLRPWVELFVNAYFQQTDVYLNFQVAKEDYFEQLAKWFEDVKFAGIAVPGQEVDKSDRLPEIFVMPDVEEISTGLGGWERDFFAAGDVVPATLRDRQRDLMREQRERSLLESRAGSKFSASELVKPNQSRNKAVLLGAPGSGKTTLMSYFAVMLARRRPEALGLAADADWLPILIRIRDWERHSEEMTLLEYAREFAEKSMAAKTLPVGFFEHWLEEGRGLILLDGLDEVAQVGKRDRVVRRIETFLQQYGKNFAIVTSRPAGYRGDFFRTEEFPHYQLQPFDEEKIDRFIDNWYNSRVRDRAEAGRRKESLRGALEDSDRLKLLARNPLLLTIIALVHRYQAVLPKERHKLYDRAVDTLLTSWDAYKEISSHKVLKHLGLDDLRRLMEILAYWVHSQGSVGDNEGGTLIDKDELRLRLSREIKILKEIKLYEAEEEAERFLGLMQERAGLLNEQGQDCYAFAHKTFQEYLCARDIKYRAEDDCDFAVVREHILEYLHDPHWREVLLLLVAQQTKKNAAKAIRTILEAGSEYEVWLHRDLLFAGSCLAENPPYLQVADRDLSREILQRLVELEVSAGFGLRIRWRVLKILCSFKETEFQGQALELLKERSNDLDEVRFAVYRAALGEQEKAIAILLAWLKDEDSYMRWNAADALGYLGNSSEVVVSALVAQLEDEDSYVRSMTAEALGNLVNSSQTVVIALVAKLEDEDYDVRKMAGKALGNLVNSSPTLVRDLVARLEDEDSAVRWMAVDALGNLGNSSEAVVSALLALLKDEDSYVRRRTVLAFWALRNSSETIQSALLARLKDEDSCVRGTAALALSFLSKNSETVVSALLPLLEDEDYDVRKRTARALGYLGNSSETAVNSLMAQLEDRDYVVRPWSAEALGYLGNSSETVVSALVALLENEDSDLRQKTVSALGKLGKKSSDVVAAVLQWIEQHQDSEYLGDGIDALWEIVAGEQS